MRKLNLYWMTNPDWYDYADEDGTEPFLTEEAPPEARASFQRYIEQKKELGEL